MGERVRTRPLAKFSKVLKVSSSCLRDKADISTHIPRSDVVISERSLIAYVELTLVPPFRRTRLGFGCAFASYRDGAEPSAGQNFMGKLSMELGTQSVFFLWTDIQEYKAIPTVDYRYTKAKQVLLSGHFHTEVEGVATTVCTF